MQVRVTEVKSDKSIAAKIEKASGKDMPLKKDGWQFSWKSLYKTEGADFYKNPVPKAVVMSTAFSQIVQ